LHAGKGKTHVVADCGPAAPVTTKERGLIAVHIDLVSMPASKKVAVKTTAWKDEVISYCVTRVVLLSITTHTGDRVTILFEYVLLDQRVPAISDYDAVSVPVVVTIVMQESIADMHPLTF
jgi:hypothetical protein